MMLLLVYFRDPKKVLSILDEFSHFGIRNKNFNEIMLKIIFSILNENYLSKFENTFFWGYNFKNYVN